MPVSICEDCGGFYNPEHYPKIHDNNRKCLKIKSTTFPSKPLTSKERDSVIQRTKKEPNTSPKCSARKIPRRKTRP